MIPFSYTRATDVDQTTLQLASAPRAKCIGGGTNLLDLMKMGVETPEQLIDVNPLPLAKIEEIDGAGGLRIGALARNSDVAEHPLVIKRYPLLREALLSGASPQLRNMATVGGNLLQRTRCPYFCDPAFPACNKRKPGSGCGALEGFNRMHAILGQSDHCIATHPSDMCVALAALDAVIHVSGPQGKREIPMREFHRLPANTPEIETTLQPSELIVAVDLPRLGFSENSAYIKVRDRASYAFAVVSVAAGLEMASDGSIKTARIALGGVAHKPWRAFDAEPLLIGKRPNAEVFAQAAEMALAGARGYKQNKFKIELARRSIVRALAVAAHAG